MKRLLAMVILIAGGCSDHNDKQSVTYHERRKSAINILVDSFKSQYMSAASKPAKDSVLSDYQEKIEKFLSAHYLNHIRVHIDSVINKNLTIDTKFHAGVDLVFMSSIEFHKRMPRKEDSFYQFMKNLKVNTDTNIDFMYIGKFELHPPPDSSKPVLIVNAYPLSYQVHGKR
ncbi:MAG TPA: hypothetical protein VGH64_10330 [Puia sp.]|jgi:hypothetical protein